MSLVTATHIRSEYIEHVVTLRQGTNREHSGTPNWYTKDPSCAYPVNEYLWLNNLHPTFPIHNATAAAIAKQLSK